MEVVKAVQISNDYLLNDDESLYQFIVEYIEIEKLMIQIFNVQTGYTYKTYIEKTDEWFQKNIYLFQGDFNKSFNIIKNSLVNNDKKLPYVIEESNDIIKLCIEYKCDIFPFELKIDIPKFISHHGELEDKVNRLEYQIKRLKQKITEQITKNDSGENKKIYNSFGNLIYKGSIKDGKPHGKGIQYFNGTSEILYEGDFKHGLYDGNGKLYTFSSYGSMKSNSYHEGEFSKGFFNKTIIMYSDEIKNSEVEYINGIQEGVYISYHANGNISNKYNTKDGKMDGEYKVYNDKGQLTQTQHYKDGKSIQ